MQELFVEGAAVGLIAHGQIQPGLFLYDGFKMGEGIKAGLAVIGPMPLSRRAASTGITRPLRRIPLSVTTSTERAFSPRILSPSGRRRRESGAAGREAPAGPYGRPPEIHGKILLLEKT